MPDHKPVQGAPPNQGTITEPCPVAKADIAWHLPGFVCVFSSQAALQAVEVEDGT